MKGAPTFKNAEGKFIYGRDLVDRLHNAVERGDKSIEIDKEVYKITPGELTAEKTPTFIIAPVNE